jgi:hypothetical protein
MNYSSGIKWQVIIATSLILLITIGLWFLSQAFLILLLWLMFFPLMFSFGSGLMKGILFREWDTLIFAVKITNGNFIYEKNHNKGFLTIISRLFWEQPQTFLGNFGMHLLNSVWLIKRVDTYKRALVCQGSFLNGGGIALGSFIMIDLLDDPVVEILPMDDRKVAERILIRHEYGHLLQSISSGPLYIFKYGIPSIITQKWTEVDADMRSDNELLLTEHIMPIFNNHRYQTKAINPKWWEYLITPAIIAGGFYYNDLSGALGGALLSTILITALNIKHPV